ncbi:MAG: hypothetical protein SNH13_07720, partial [Rikenellaceae bacterium]
MITSQIQLPTAEPIFQSDKIVPGNIAISRNGRIFISTNPLLKPSVKLLELLVPGGDVVPFPD